MNNIKTWFNNKFIPQAAKLGNQRHLATIRDAFAVFTPIIIVGALAVLWRSVIFPQGWAVTKSTLPGLWGSFNDHAVTGTSYLKYLDVVNHLFLYVQVGTINVMSVYVAFGIGYFLANSRGHNAPVIAGLVSMAVFFAMTNLMISGGTWEGGMYWLGARGLITAIVFGLLGTELFVFLSKGDRMAINMPAGVPPAVSRAFAKLFPAMLTIMAAGLANLLVWMPFYFLQAQLIEGTSTTVTINLPTGGAFTATQEAAIHAALGKDVVTTANIVAAPVTGNGDVLGTLLKAFNPGEVTTGTADLTVMGGDVNMTAAIYSGVVNPFIGLADHTSGALGIALLYVLLISFFWFFGLHGTNIVNGAFNPIWLILYANNVNGADNVFVQGTFDAYVFIGGWGATLALLAATLLFGNKKSSEYEIAKFGFAPGVFQINEPVTFGYPLVLNAYLVMPLFLVMPTLVITTFFGIEYFGVPKVSVLIPWTTPIGFGGLLASASPWGFVLAVVNFAIATAIWTPFVMMLTRRNAKAEVAEATTAKKTKEAKA